MEPNEIDMNSENEPTREITNHRGGNALNDVLRVETTLRKAHGVPCSRYRISSTEDREAEDPPAVDCEIVFHEATFRESDDSPFERQSHRRLGANGVPAGITPETLLAVTADHIAGGRHGREFTPEAHEALKCILVALFWLTSQDDPDKETL